MCQHSMCCIVFVYIQWFDKDSIELNMFENVITTIQLYYKHNKKDKHGKININMMLKLIRQIFWLHF